MDTPEILKYPDKRLRRIAREVKDITPEIRERIEAMYVAMKEDRGIGLAAPQIGWDLRLFVMNCSGEEKDNVALINPKIVETKGSCRMEEGCLSLPGIYAKIKRPEAIVVHAQNLEGEDIEIEADGLIARCIQHEFDHLDGILFIDRVKPVAKQRLKKKLKRLEEEYKKSQAKVTV